MMNLMKAEIPVIAGLFILGFAALCAIVFLSFYDHVVPSEVSAIPGVVVGALAGAYYGSRRGNEVIEKPVENP